MSQEKPILNSDQQTAFEELQKFLEHPIADTFVLKGYAGTGKTFLMQYLGKWLEETNQTFCLLASTGRAATVLQGKTGFDAKTVHSELYNFSKVEGIDEEILADRPRGSEWGQMSLQFTTRAPDENQTIYIVDEASMLSGEQSADSMFANFGSGILLDDLFEVAGKNKIIFVGDPCQLPPVKQAVSPALDVDWLTEHHRAPVSFTLQKIERTGPDNGILVLAGAIRQMVNDNIEERFPRLPAADLANVKLYPSDKDLFHEYVAQYKSKGVNGALAIARSNKTVQNINRAMRRELYGSADLPLQLKDVLLVTQNNYSVPLTNGDFVIVTNIGETKTRVGIEFQEVTVKAVLTDTEYTLLLSLDALHSVKGGLTEDQSKELMIDFSSRMKIKDIKPNSPEYRKAMMEDPYLSCLKATYGYAVTCHKAQGGEWDNVFLFLDKSMYGMPRQELFRWWYTAVTRARRQLNLVNDWWIQRPAATSKINMTDTVPA